jgi:aminoglycoside phosphotransferase (APT) family kinase protein
MVEEKPVLQVSFLDLESGGLGDPTWDLASAVDTITWLSPRWHAVAQPLVDYLILGYRRAGGPGRLYPAIQAVRALATAVWIAELPEERTGEEAQEELELWLDRARAYAARIGWLMAVA